MKIVILLLLNKNVSSSIFELFSVYLIGNDSIELLIFFIILKILLLIIIDEIIYEKINNNLILFHNCGCFSQISNGFIAYLIIIFLAQKISLKIKIPKISKIKLQIKINIFLILFILPKSLFFYF